MRYKGTPTPMGERIEGAEKKYLKKAQKEAVVALGLNTKQALRIADLTMTLKLGMAHRWVVSQGIDRSAQSKQSESLDEIAALTLPMFEALTK